MISFSSIFKIVAVVCGVEIGINKVGHLCCRICVGIEVSNLLRILLSKVTNEVSNLAIEFASDVDRIRVPTVDDQPYCDNVHKLMMCMLCPNFSLNRSE